MGKYPCVERSGRPAPQKCLLLIFKVGNHKEYDMLREEYAHLVGKDELDLLYKKAVGKGAPPYLFLTILPHEQ